MTFSFAFFVPLLSLCLNSFQDSEFSQILMISQTVLIQEHDKYL